MAGSILRYLRPAAQSSKPAEPNGGQSNVSARSLALCSMVEARAYLTREQAQKLAALPLGVVEVLGTKTLTLAVAAGDLRDAEQALRFIVDIPVRIAEVAAEVVTEAISIAYCGDAERFGVSVESLRNVESQLVHPFCGPHSIEFNPKQGEVAQFLASLVEFALSKGASDIHLLPRYEGTFLRIRVNGELLTTPEPLCGSLVHQRLIARIKVLAGIAHTASAVPTDGAFSLPFGGKEARVRVSTIPTLHGEKVVLRLLSGDAAKTLPELGLCPQAVDLLTKVTQQYQGGIFLAGPTGSGKSSTLYALAALSAARGRSVCSVEDPVERILPEMSQSQIEAERGLTFPICLRAVMRQDPDVIMLGEIRDRDTAQIAIQAALTGHLLLTSVHSGTITGTIKRLRSLGIEPELLSEAARLFVNQRLLPTLCPRCKIVDLQSTNDCGEQRFRAVGCAACDYSGFAGRAPVVQLWAPVAGELLSFDGGMDGSHSGNWLGWESQILALLAQGLITTETQAQFMASS